MNVALSAEKLLRNLSVGKAMGAIRRIAPIFIILRSKMYLYSSFLIPDS